MASTVTGDLLVTGNLIVGGVLKPLQPRSNLVEEFQVLYPVALTLFREHDTMSTNLPSASTGSYLGVTSGTYGTAPPMLSTGNVRTTTVTRYGRVVVPLPAEYQAGDAVAIQVHAGMQTTVADTAATVNVECWISNRDGTLTAAGNIVVGGAQSINSLTQADKTFQLTATTLAPGQELDIRVTLFVQDAATGGAVIANIGAVDLLCSIRG
jgi:hypothetical protein